MHELKMWNNAHVTLLRLGESAPVQVNHFSQDGKCMLRIRLDFRFSAECKGDGEGVRQNLLFSQRNASYVGLVSNFVISTDVCCWNECAKELCHKE